YSLGKGSKESFKIKTPVVEVIYLNRISLMFGCVQFFFQQKHLKTI
ncbi:MAG: hypothetical protein ACI9S8_002014, partial [Chlamydiales bacterium]